ncbi:MAG: hypothetical protein COY81_00715 [Candidatus Pacebacteria bacterium CG_4_10_14_0_8_um_filter_43_12]|nr:MAG: hypothetical protein COU66_03690 [Candidatus Pacebacteria bacterium CG10_big_fil_rev_8_21_14_0_10_44_11]PIY79803.1 MAG: hypothetical protein COY81_00715 [Candidatus Pacebacteria bacterium CG_4_10_14_0_8_um_filter_43_12]
MKKFLAQHLALLLILVLALILRLYKIDSPILDWHSFRQADTASVTREYLKHGIDLLHPTYQDLSNIQSGQDNLEGYRMVEFPVLNGLVASILLFFPSFSLEMTHRLVSVLFSLGSVASLFFLVKQLSGKRVAYLSSFFLAVLPYSVYYARSTLPEPMMLFLFIYSLLALLNWLQTKKLVWYAVCLVSLSLALLIKPFILFFLPIYIALGYFVQTKKVLKNWPLYLGLLAACLPFIWWRSWIQHFPSGIPASTWLYDGNLNQVNQSENKLIALLQQLFGYHQEGIRYHPAWFRWLGFERLTKLLLGYWGIVLLPFAFNRLKKNELVVYLTGWLSLILFVIVIARGNIQHDYYQVLWLPVLVMTVARGAVQLETMIAKRFNPLVALTTLIALIVGSIFFAWQQVSGFYNINHPEYMLAGVAVDSHAPPDAKVIAPAFGDTMFLFQTNRTGWPIGYNIDEKIANGASYYVSASYDDEAHQLEEKYFTIKKTPDYILLDLTKKKNAQL